MKISIDHNDDMQIWFIKFDSLKGESLAVTIPYYDLNSYSSELNRIKNSLQILIDLINIRQEN